MSTPGAKPELDDKTAVQYGSYENGHDHAAIIGEITAAEEVGTITLS